jgi:hypothetical protein
MENSKLKTFSVHKNNKLISIPESEYIEDNLLYHSLVHVLEVLSNKIDSLQNKGYIFQQLKRQANIFRIEFYKHTSFQSKIMHENGSGVFYNQTQKDFDEVIDFISESKPARITMLAKIIRENKELNNFSELDLVNSIKNGDIIIESENEGKSGMFKNK